MCYNESMASPQENILDTQPAELGPAEAGWLEKGLSSVGSFSQLGREQLAKILPYMLLIRYDQGAVLCEEGAEGDALYLIYQGSVTVTKKGWDKPVATLKEGAVIGEMALLFGQPRSATVTTAEASVLFCLSAIDFQRLMEKHPDLVVSMLRIAQERQLELRRS